VKTEEGSGCIEWINRYRSESNVFTPETVLSSQRVPFAQRDHATGPVIGFSGSLVAIRIAVEALRNSLNNLRLIRYAQPDYDPQRHGRCR